MTDENQENPFDEESTAPSETTDEAAQTEAPVLTDEVPPSAQDIEAPVLTDEVPPSAQDIEPPEEDPLARLQQRALAMQDIQNSLVHMDREIRKLIDENGALDAMPATTSQKFVLLQKQLNRMLYVTWPNFLRTL